MNITTEEFRDLIKIYQWLCLLGYTNKHMHLDVTLCKMYKILNDIRKRDGNYKFEEDTSTLNGEWDFKTSSEYWDALK